MSKKKQLTTEELLEEAFVLKDEQPYEVPMNWIWVNLNSVTKLVVDGSHNPPPKLSVGIPMISGKNIHDGSMDFYTDRYVSDDDYKKEFKRTPIEMGDILLNIVGSIGRTTIVPKDAPKFVMQRSVSLIKPSIDNRYLMYFFQSPYFQHYLQTNAKGTAQKGIYLKTLKSSSIALPPYKEQKRIVVKLENLLSRIDEAKRLIEEAKETFELRRAAILDKAFKGDLTKKWRSEYTDYKAVQESLKIISEEKALLKSKLSINKKSVDNHPFNIPKEWKWVYLEDITISFKNGLYKSADYYSENGIPCLRMYNIRKGELNFDDMHYMKLTDEEVEEFGLKYGDVLINRVNSRELVGKSAPVPANFAKCVYESKNIRARLSTQFNPYYISWCLELPYVKSLILDSSKQTVGMATVNQEFLKSIPIPMPTLKEQNEIVSLVSSLLIKGENALDILKDLRFEILKQSILSKAFRGEIGTNDPNDENAIHLLKEMI